jgi:hypothetical protein
VLGVQGRTERSSSASQVGRQQTRRICESVVVVKSEQRRRKISRMGGVEKQLPTWEKNKR